MGNSRYQTSVISSSSEESLNEKIEIEINNKDRDKMEFVSMSVVYDECDYVAFLIFENRGNR